jgi:protocatechuate 3,4-dioxygenase beta subunit
LFFLWYRDGKAGIPLRLSVAVIDTSNCTPLVNALVDVWHCDAVGIYSHYIAASQGIAGTGNDNETFFRGMLYLMIKLCS